jgi:hypothetical protein
MNGKALLGGLKSYLGALIAVVLFPVFWLRSLRLARRHADTDARGPAKVLAAIVASVLIGGGGIVLLLGFQADATAGMYDSFETRLSSTVGEAEYQDSLAAVSAADAAIPVIERNLANETDDGKRAELQAALDAQRKARSAAAANALKLEPNHALFQRLVPLVEAQDDAAVVDAVAEAGLDYPARMVEGTQAALAIKDKAVGDMQLFMWVFLWPSLAGAFYAPVVFALGSVLRSAFVPSDTVGFKPYPGAAAGWFLLFGAFGLPSVPFAAWTFLDAEGRSREGQIAL